MDVFQTIMSKELADYKEVPRSCQDEIMITCTAKICFTYHAMHNIGDEKFFQKRR